MMIGHLPSAYLVFKAMAPRALPRIAFLAGMGGALFPDIDLLWFYFVDNRSTHHHEYLTHRPALWLGLMILFLGTAWLSGKRRGLVALGIIGAAFCAGALTHMVFDSIAGKIFWLWPLTDHSVTLVTVQPTHSHFILSFLAHWTFKMEIAITIVAATVFLYVRYRRSRIVEVEGSALPGDSD